MSFLVRFTLFAYICVLVYNLVTDNDDKMYHWPHDFREDLGEETVLIRDTNNVLFTRLQSYDDDGNLVDLPYDEETRRHIRIIYSQQTMNTTANPRFNLSKTYEAIPCTEENFKVVADPDMAPQDPKVGTTWESWKDIPIVCDKLDSEHELLGQESDAFTKSQVMQIVPCSNEFLKPGEKSCHWPTAIQNFIERLHFETWANTEHICLTSQDNYKMRGTCRYDTKLVSGKLSKT